jgi:hypothetical protein
VISRGGRQLGDAGEEIKRKAPLSNTEDHAPGLLVGSNDSVLGWWELHELRTFLHADNID